MADRTIKTSIEVNEAMFRAGLNKMEAQVFKFRDSLLNVGKSVSGSGGGGGSRGSEAGDADVPEDPGNPFSNFFRRAINSAALFIRRLARIRTAFFILVTFLGARQIVRVFEDIIAQSSLAENSVKAVKDKYATANSLIGDTLAPAAAATEELFSKVKQSVIVFLLQNASKLGDFVRFLDYTVQSFIKLGAVISYAVTKLEEFFAKAARETEKGILEQRIASLGEKLVLLTSSNFKRITDKESPYKNFFRDENGVMSTTSVLPEETADSIRGYITEAQNELFSLKEKIKAGKLTFKEYVQQWVAGFFSETFGVKSSPIVDKFAKKMDALETMANSPEFLARLKHAGENDAEQFAQGFKDGILKNLATVRSVSFQLGQDVQKGFEGFLSDSFFNTMEGKFNKFSDIFVSFLKSIQRSIANFLASAVVADLLNALSGNTGPNGGVLSGVGKGITGVVTGLVSGLFGGGAAGGSGGFSLNGTQYTSAGVAAGGASGNIVYNPSIRPMAEHGPEAIIPLQYLFGMSGKSGANVTVNFNAIDGPSTASWFRANKSEVINIMTEAVNGGNQGVRNSFAHR